MGESAYFVFGLLGLFAGYIVGDVQRELRWRRDARKNLELAVDRLPSSRSGTYLDLVPNDDGPDSGANSHSDADSSPGGSLGSLRDGQARRRAVRRADGRLGADPAVRGRRSGFADAQTVGAAGYDYDCG